jgi:hypothetical protein
MTIPVAKRTGFDKPLFVAFTMSTFGGYSRDMMNALTFADAVGRKKIAEALGVGATAVSNGVVRGKFPSSWFLACQDLAHEAGVDCPPELFGMRTTAASEDAA